MVKILIILFMEKEKESLFPIFFAIIFIAIFIFLKIVGYFCRKKKRDRETKQKKRKTPFKQIPNKKKRR